MFFSTILTDAAKLNYCALRNEQKKIFKSPEQIFISDVWSILSQEFQTIKNTSEKVMLEKQGKKVTKMKSYIRRWAQWHCRDKILNSNIILIIHKGRMAPLEGAWPRLQSSIGWNKKVCRSFGNPPEGCWNWEDISVLTGINHPAEAQRCTHPNSSTLLKQHAQQTLDTLNFKVTFKFCSQHWGMNTTYGS